MVPADPAVSLTAEVVYLEVSSLSIAGSSLRGCLDVMQLKAVDINSLESTVLRQFFPG